MMFLGITFCVQLRRRWKENNPSWLRTECSPKTTGTCQNSESLPPPLKNCNVQLHFHCFRSQAINADFFFFLTTPIPSFMCAHTSNNLTGRLWSLHLLESQHKSQIPCAQSSVSTEQRSMNRDLILCPCSYHRAQEARTKPPQMNHCSGTN